jgi:replicative DNA helicase
VWDIGVDEHHSFIANDVLVHNSGAAEANADVVILLHRPAFRECIKTRAKTDKAELIIGKQRNGPLGKVRVLLDLDCVRFLNEAAEMPPEADELPEE